MPGYSDDRDAVIKRLKRVEGQVRGIQRMVEDDTYCIDVLTQISAVNKALQAVALSLLDDHLGHCVASARADGDLDAKLAEASAAIARLVRA
jgi:DNA-binding FrmR family transcriptional regulator